MEEKASERTQGRLAKQILILLAIAMAFAAFHISVYFLLTRRLANNFSDVTQLKMTDVGSYLPHDPDAKLVRIDSSLKLTEDLPVLDGAAALLPVYAAFVDAVYPAGSVTYEGGTFSDDNYYGENFAPDSSMQYHNTVRGYQAIVDGETDLFFSVKPSAEQAAYAKQQGVELVYVPIGREAFVFFVNEKNPVEGLSTAQIRSIYSGEIRNWKEVGGPDRVINPVSRVEGSGSQSAMNAFMGERKTGRKSPFAVTGASLGFSFRYYLEDMVGNGGVKMLSVNEIYPDEENIRSGLYPITTEFYAIFRKDNPNPNIPVLVDWILSEEGQRIIEETGYVGIQGEKNAFVGRDVL